MYRETDDPPQLRAARWMLLPAHVVYDELKRYGESLSSSGRVFFGDEDLERRLLGRGEPLIDLALGQFASSPAIVAQLYRQGRAGVLDHAYDQALRIACLSNRLAPEAGFFAKGYEGFEGNEIRELITSGEDDEVVALLRNPAQRKLLAALFAREGPAAAVDDERWMMLVRIASQNSGLNRDDSSEHGPDSYAWDLHKAIFQLVASAPVTGPWAETLHALLQELDPGAVHLARDNDQAREALQRWAGVSIKARFKREEDNEDEEGDLTSLSKADEFRCLLAALYGRSLKDSRLTPLGEESSEGLPARCSWYARTRMTFAQVEAAHARDGEAFMLAAIFNDELLLDRRARSFIESNLWRGQAHLYRKRCEQLHARRPGFNPTPGIKDLQEQETQTAAAATAPAPAALQGVQDLMQQVARLRSTFIWGAAILGILILVS